MNKSKEYTLNALFYLYLLIIIGTRLLVYFKYNLEIIDTDQPYMWQGAIDYAKGLFYEPRYYGQDYNTFMEAFFAAPLLYFNLPVYKVLPLVTNFLSLFPYLFMAFYLFFRNQKAFAIAILGVLICLPPQYDLLNSIPRGFVTGLFFTSCLFLSLINPQNLFLIFLNTALAVLGFYVNQNSIIVSGPFLAYLFFIHYKDKTYYYSTGTAILLAYPIDLFFNKFYRAHPDYVCQSTFNTFSPEYFIKSITHLNERFQHVSFFLPNQSYTLLATLILLGFLLFKKNIRAFKAILVLILILLISFFASKVSDGSPWVFMSFSRLYLGIPLLMCLFLPLTQLEFKKTGLVLLFVPLLFSIYKINNLKSELDKEDQRTIAQGVRVLSIKSCFEMTNFYKNICEENQCDFLLVSSTFWLNTIISTAGPCIIDNYPETQETRFEKKYWVRNKNKNRLIERFVFLSSEFDLDKILPPNQKFTLKRLDDYGLFLVENNQLPMDAFIDNINAVEPGLND